MTTDTTRSAVGAPATRLGPLHDLASYRSAYAAGASPAQVIADLLARIEADGPAPVWISVMPLAQAMAMLAAAQARRDAGGELPLFGIPFAVKDNIDVLGLPTTAGCPEFAYEPQQHAFVVQQLVDAGAIPVGKTNLDQFATGLNGSRSPYGIPRCVFDQDYVSGGSSSGSAVAVANGSVVFALGTDTAGSGRVPASFNNLVGLKPTKGLFSGSGLVPAARSLDCISVFAHTVDDALAVTRVAAGYDVADAFSRQAGPAALAEKQWPNRFTFGVPAAHQLEFFGDDQAEALFAQAIEKLEGQGGTCVRFDYLPFQQAAQLLYAGPWVAERLAAIEDFVERQPEAVHPVVRDIVLSARGMSAVDTFNAIYRLADYVRQAEQTWRAIDVMLLPTAPTIYTVEQMLADPVLLNSNLGYYTNFVNLMDLSAIAVPAGLRGNGLPFGVTFVGRAFEDGAIACLARAFTNQQGGQPAVPSAAPAVAETIAVAVVGAHLSGQPLNHQLTGRGARLRSRTRTAPGYALYALANTTPEKPGMIRDASAAGNIEVEIWDLPLAGFGAFVDEIPAPLGIGTVTLEDGSTVKGFLCEPYALQQARDITHLGGWRAYRASLAQAGQPAP
ncbi:allophanate hydrolase [Herbaspirillum sp. YR522]|uniref:allophanate hydrolase n=1 Tax=Herbaspirillum sp. YR522 TaxID=1144342 RepID=UPI00026FBBEE|nr:allophanate hydrolase [Herbaspirillum sp. YR522]EJN08687.1 allophanate hydrolase [Herbaspirillum sp. YR522]